MLTRNLVILAVAGFAAIQVPKAYEAYASRTPAMQGAAAEPVAAPSGAIAIKADRSGHFQTTFRINGKPVEGLIDTGASLVAINESAARRLGYGATALDFKYPVNTANGQTSAAHVLLKRVEIGSIRVDGVDAFVLKDEALSGTLIGMTFLRRLGKYSVENGVLNLAR